MTIYFSDRQNGSKPRNEEILSPSVWGGLVARIQSLIGTGAFAFKFPELCPDGAGVSGTDSDALGLAIQAEMPGLTWPLQTTIREKVSFSGEKKPFVPDTLLILDFIELCYRLVAEPIQGSYHSYFGHHHLSFDPEAGREMFREDVNRIFARNGIAYELEIDGQIHRLLPPVLGHDLASSLFDTEDSILDQMLEESRLKFSNRDSKIRREALERLWDCWERLKSLELPNPKAKRQSITILFLFSCTLLYIDKNTR